MSWDDILKGTNGADYLNGGSGDDFLQGKAGGDTLEGGDGNDQIHGDSGDDHIRGGRGNDFINGGIGIDTAYYSGSIVEYSHYWTGEDLFLSHVAGTGADGYDRLLHVERLVFADAVIDLTQNNAPVAFNDAAATNEDVGTYSSGSVSVLDNDFDWEGDSLSVTAGSFNGTYGTLVLQSDGTYTYTPHASAQALAQGQVVQDSFTYTVSDGSLTDTATLTITLSGVNDAPVANADTASGHENQTLTINVLANDADVDNGAVLTVVAASAPAGKGTASIVGNQVQFNPGADFDHLAQGASEIVVLNYTIQDEHGAQSSSTVSVTVTGTNDGPVAAADTAAGHENQVLTVDVLANDDDVDDGAVLTVVAASGPAGKGTVSIVGNQVQFDPGTDFDHLADGVSEVVVVNYTIEDEHGASASSTLTITVTGTNDGPVANPDTASTGENSPVTVNVLANDTDADDGAVLTVVAASAPSGQGTATVVAGNQVEFDPGTDFDYLDVGETAQVVVSYTIEDQHGAQSSSSVTITVSGANDAPVANDDTATTDENTSISGNVLANDTDVDGETLTVTNAATFIGAYGTLVLNSNGSYTYTPGGAAALLDNGETANDVFNYIVSDGTATDTATLTITVTGLSGAPDAIDDTASTTEDAAVSGNVLTNDTDPESDTLTVTDAGTYVGTYGTLNLAADGSYTYTPNAAADGLAAGETAQDIFTYTASDGSASDTATLTVTVTGTNDAPTIDAGGTTATGSVTELPDGDPNEGTAVHTASGAVAFDDVDASDTHSASFTPQGAFYLGTFSLDPVDQTGDSVGWDFSVSDAALEGLAEGEIRIQTYTIEVDDGHGGTATQDVTVTITGAGVGAGPQTVWYIDNSAVGSANLGTEADPYTSIAAFNAAQGTPSGPQTGHTVYLLAGTGTGVYAENDGINLLNGQILVGVPTGAVRPTIQATAGDGINVAQNNNVSGLDIGNTSGADIADSGGSVGTLTITDVGSSGTGRIIDVDQGGTLNVTLNDAASTASSGGAIDLNGVGGSFTVTGATTIAGATGGGVDVTGATGLTVTFQGTLTAATGATTGINYVGNSGGGLTISGTGNSITTTSGVAVNLGTSSNIAISNATITSATNSAILGATVTDFALTDSVVTGGPSVSAIGFTNLTGTADLTGNVISGGFNNVSVANSAGSLDLTIEDSGTNQAVIGLTSLNGNDGVLVQTSGSASLTLTVEGVDFLGARGDLLQATATGSSTQDIAVTNSTFNNTHTNVASGGGGVTLSGGGAGSNITVDYVLEGNVFTGADGNAVSAYYTPADGTIRGYIADNVVGVNDGVAGSEGSAGGGDGIFVGLEKLSGSGTASHTVTIEGNEIYDVAFGLGGINIRSGSGGGTGAVVEATVTDNVVDENGAFAAFYSLVGGSSGGDSSQLGINMTNNVWDSGDSAFGNNAVTFDQLSEDAHYYFPGYTGSADGEFSSGAGIASADLDVFLAGQGNVMTNGGFPLQPGGVDASFVTGVTGDPLTLPVWFG